MTIKNTLFMIPAFGLAGFINAQSVKSDSIFMGAGYSDEIFYDLNTGTKTSAAVSNWDIAHTSDVRDNCVKVNHMMGIEVFYYPKANNSGWSTFDTSGWMNWNRYYNDIHDHKKGALNYQSNPPFGIGWGTYNSSSHETIGDSLYLLAWSNGSGGYTKFLKFQPIKQMVNGNFIFRYANIDGSNERQDTLFQSAANGQNYKYFSFSNSKPVREPANTTWDIAFNRYYEPVQAGPDLVMYPVMGVETNRGTKAVKISGQSWSSVLADSANLIDNYVSSMTDDLTNIGSNWKLFDNMLFKWSLVDDLSYIVKSVRNGDSLYWLMRFTGFGGNINGKVVFDKMLLGKTNSVFHPKLGTLSVFPVPATNVVYLVLENAKAAVTEVVITDMKGQQVYSNKTSAAELSAIGVPLNSLSKGNYIISVQNGEHRMSSQIVVQ